MYITINIYGVAQVVRPGFGKKMAQICLAKVVKVNMVQ